MNSLYRPSKKDKKVYKNMEVAIVVPCGDYEMSSKFVKSMANMIAYSWHCGLKVYEIGTAERMVVHWARNELAKNTLERVNPHTGRPFTHVMWLDDDHVFNADMLVYLARHGNLDCVSAVYYCRTGRILPVVYVKDEDPDPYKHYPLLHVPETLFEVDAVGFGAFLMDMDVLRKLEYPYFKFENCGEDIYFCVKAKEAGIKIWVDGSYRMGHIGEPGIVTHKTYEQYLQDNQEELGDIKRVSLGGKVHG